MQRTFRKQAGLAGLDMFSQKPAIAKLVIFLDQFDAISSSEIKFVARASREVIYRKELVYEFHKFFRNRTYGRLLEHLRFQSCWPLRWTP
jgi:hypothetical protein